MIKNRGLWFIVGGFIYISIITLCLNKYMVLADTLIEQVEDIQDNMDDRLINYSEEFEQSDDKILQDTISSFEVFQDQEKTEDDLVDLHDVIKPLKSGSRSMTNTYNGSNSWLFTQSYYQTLNSIRYSDINDNSFSARVYIFQYNKLPSYDLISDFVNFVSGRRLADFPDLQVYVVYNSVLNGVEVNINTKSLHDSVSDYLNNYGYPDSNCYWQAPEPTGGPEPTTTPEPTPTPEPVPIEIDNSVFVMIIFGLGLIAGVLSGNILTGFIK